jgi:hypothetical protein
VLSRADCRSFHVIGCPPNANFSCPATTRVTTLKHQVKTRFRSPLPGVNLKSALTKHRSKAMVQSLHLRILTIATIVIAGFFSYNFKSQTRGYKTKAFGRQGDRVVKEEFKRLRNRLRSRIPRGLSAKQLLARKISLRPAKQMQNRSVMPQA